MKRLLLTTTIFLAGLLAGVGATLAVQSRVGASPAMAASAPSLRHPLQVRLHRMEIQDGKLGRYADWQRFLHVHHDDAVATLAREHMYVEAMFRDVDRDPQVLYWLEVRDAAGARVDDSLAEVDREHLRYMREVLRDGRHTLLETENTLVAPFVQAAIAANQAAGPPP
ncbi:MAG: DUF6176 family protein [Pseudoxanthomonas sp.]